MNQIMSMSMTMGVLALVAAVAGERWWSLTSQGAAFGLILAVCVGQSVMVLIGGPRGATR